MVEEKDGKLKLKNIRKNSLPNPNGLRKSVINKKSNGNGESRSEKAMESELNLSR